MKLLLLLGRRVSRVARKKIVFVIVEGPSDAEALGVILNRIYDNKTVFVHIMHKDITAEYRTLPNNIISKIGDEVRGYAKSNHFSKNDFKEIIHIVDMDGAYIPSSSIIEDSSALKPIYSLKDIRTCNKHNIEQRNHNKSLNINRICSYNDKIWGVAYRVFYMSCNLDHALYNKLNSNDEEKENDSYLFAVKYKDDISGFLDFITNSDFSVVNGYKESWDFIKQDHNSLKRFTNLGLCFKGE